MSLRKINDHQLGWTELKQLKLNIEDIVGKSVELFEETGTGTWTYIFILPNGVGNRLPEVRDLIDSLLLELRKNISSRYTQIKVRVDNEMTYSEFYEKLEKLCKDIRYEIDKLIERIEPSVTTSKLGKITSLLSKLEEIRTKIKNYPMTNINEFISDTIIDDTKRKINYLEYEIGQLGNEGGELGINKINKLAEDLDSLEKSITSEFRKI